MVRTAGLATARTIAAASSTVWMNCVVGGGERLDAIDDAGLAGRLGNGGEALGAPFAPIGLPAGLERALGRRAVHEHAPPRSAARSHRRPHDLDRAGTLRGIAGGDRQPLRRQHQVVQPGDGDAGLGCGPAHVGAPRGRQQVRLVGQRERRDLEPVVPDLAGELALPLERQLADDLVAKRNAHRHRPLLCRRIRRWPARAWRHDTPPR